MTATATREQVLDLVRWAIETVLEVEPATFGGRSRLVADLAADSLALVEIVELTEAGMIRLTGRPDLTLDDDDFEQLVTVDDAVDYALSRQ